MWTFRICKNYQGPRVIRFISRILNRSLSWYLFSLTQVFFSLTFCLTLFQIANSVFILLWAPYILAGFENLGHRLSKSVKNIRRQKYVGVINRLYPQKQSFLQIHTNPGPAQMHTVENSKPWYVYARVEESRECRSNILKNSWLPPPLNWEGKSNSNIWLIMLEPDSHLWLVKWTTIGN